MVTKNYSSLSQVRNCGLLLLAIDIILYNGALFAKLVLLKKVSKSGMTGDIDAQAF